MHGLGFDWWSGTSEPLLWWIVFSITMVILRCVVSFALERMGSAWDRRRRLSRRQALIAERNKRSQ